MEKQEAILQHKIRSIDDKIYDLIQEKKQLQNDLDLLGVIVATHDKELDITLIDSDINTWSEEKKVYFELVNKLNEPERTYALENFDESNFKPNVPVTIFYCIDKGFKWDKSPQGLKYWMKIADSLFCGTYQFDRI